jgi:hypothetical protein
MQTKTLGEWRLPRYASANKSVKLNLRIDRAGRVQCLSLSPDSERNLARSVVEAVHRVATYGPVPEGASCLTDVPITAIFSNPEAKKSEAKN